MYNRVILADISKYFCSLKEALRASLKSWKLHHTLALVESVSPLFPCLRYCSCEEFAADAQLVFNNCELFNEDTSEVGMAGHAMRQFFESRWAEFYSNKDK